MLTFVDRLRGVGEVGVPRRLSVGALFLLLTFYSVLFRLLVFVGAESRWTGITCLYFGAVTVGQMILFRGTRPRAASIVTGAVACPALLLAVVMDEALTQFTGWTPLAGGLREPTAFVAAVLMSSMVGMFLGYVFGGAIASVFFVTASLFPQLVIARDDGHLVDQSPGVDRGTALVEAVARWVNPLQPRAPCHGAFAAWLLTVTAGCLISPFGPWAWRSDMILFAAGLGILFAIWTGNLQLSFFWPVALCSLGAMLAAWPATTFLQIPRYRDIVAERPDLLVFFFRVFGSCAGLTIAAVAGWTQWLANRGQAKRRLGFAPFFACAAILVGMAWLLTYRLEAWAQSPRQQLFAKIQADGGALGWNSPTGGKLRWVLLTEASGDDEFLRLQPLLASGIAVDLRGRGFTDKSVSILDGLHFPSLRLIDTSITDGAFDQLNYMSATSVTLNMTDVGDQGLARLTALPGMPTALQSLTLTETKVGDDGLAHLAPCRSLLWLSLAHCDISDEGLKSLAAAAPPIRQLNLVGTGISDKGLAHLAQLKSLAELRVNATRVTQAGIDALKKSLPNCDIHWDGGG